MPSVAVRTRQLLHPTLLAERVQALRQARGWNQRRLAREAGLAPNQVSQIEGGVTQDPRISTLRALADALEVSLDVLTGREALP